MAPPTSPRTIEPPFRMTIQVAQPPATRWIGMTTAGPTRSCSWGRTPSTTRCVTPLILREIVLFDRHHFSEIQHGVGRISQSLLSQRLRTLEAAGVIERRPNRTGRGSEYHPTAAGRELETVLNELGIWAQHWLELRQQDCEPSYLMMTTHAILRPERLPA